MSDEVPVTEQTEEISPLEKELFHDMTQEDARAYVFGDLSITESFFLARCHDLIAVNCSTALTAFTATPTTENQAKYDELMKEIRTLGIADQFFFKNHDPNYSKSVVDSAKAQIEARKNPKPKPLAVSPDGQTVQEPENTVAEAVLTNAQKVAEMARTQGRDAALQFKKDLLEQIAKKKAGL